MTPTPVKVTQTVEEAMVDQGPGKGQASSADEVTVVVLSDIHATAKAGETHVAEDTASNPKQNALTAARKFLKEEVGAADFVLCPGDLVHKGEPDPMDWVWDQLVETAEALGARLVASAGNHDLIREPKGGVEPAKTIRELKPKFPYEDMLCIATYWAHDFAIVEEEAVRVVSLNSCAMHGGYDAGEGLHGRLRPSCLKELDRALDDSDFAGEVNICLVHHHPQEWTHKGDNKTNHLFEGDLLIDLLEQRPERWMLIHGHKHHPSLDYLGGGSSGPVRLAAGSVGVDLLADSGITVRNQIHIVNFKPAERESGLLLAGEIRSLEWAFDRGWVPADAEATLPDRAHFGYRRDGYELASAFARIDDPKRWDWASIVQQEPRCAYLTPADLESFFDGVRALGGGVVHEPRHDFLEVTFPR